MCSPLGGLIPGAGPPGTIPGGGIMERPPPCGVLAAYEGGVDRKAVGRWEHHPAGGGAGWSRRCLASLAEMLRLFCQSGFEPALPSISERFSHSLCFRPRQGLSPRWTVVSEVCVAGVTIEHNHHVLQALGHSVTAHTASQCQPTPIFYPKFYLLHFVSVICLNISMKHFSFLEMEFLSQILYVFETFDTFVPKL